MTPTPPEPRSPRDVFLLAQHNPVVARHLAAWTSGAFASWEDMLVSLVVELEGQLRRRTADYNHRVEHFLLTLGR